ncbi:hypothetical protein O1Q96_27290 [Streptomyces sp. Qhu-G9]|uniref:hypothetical protein n=1 Tax=Streptomyces sp. Qhu-G9 TaxID=3452799 RepID=UPI0022AC2B94|nr:hypothetical protein [Streptomyces aurantiacus]WAU83067.1 hypothetical protein O1Q96_27290 [Streptomyces aurantiacus]
MGDFDRIFEPQYSATELFTNRVDEYTAFSAALRLHAARVRNGSAVLSTGARRNVVCFYGIGGIGKTELSRRLESWTRGTLSDPGDWLENPPSGDALHSVRVDFHGSRVVNAADIALRLRAAVAGRRRSFPAFDLGLAAWWSLARPGTLLPDLSVGGFDVRGQITDTLNETLSDAGASFGIGPLTVRTGIRIVEAVQGNRLRNRTLHSCEPLVHIVNQTQQDPSDYVAATLAGLLSWDLENLPPDKRPLVVVFADAAEYVQGEDRAQERLFNRIVSLTPGVLWVVTSRNRLDWDSPNLHQLLPATGPQTWPQLRLESQQDPRQHLVGNLSDTDVERYLLTASGSAGNPVLAAEVINSIRSGAHGLPLYLSLSLSVARAAHGRPLAADAFGGPLPELATRVFANLPEKERELARAASLVPRFDEDLITQATHGLLGDANRLCRRTLVTRDQHPLFPYRLHDAVRAAIAHESVAEPGAWAPADRTAMARQLLETLRHRSNALVTDSERRLDVLEIAAALCSDHDLEATWLIEALINLPGFAQTAGRLPPPAAGTWMGQVSGMFEAWRPAHQGRRRLTYLQTFLESPLKSDVNRHCRRRLAYQHRNRGEAETALRLLTELLIDQPDSELLRYQIARTLYRIGHFTELEQHLSHYPLREPTTGLRISSDLAYDRGLLNESIVGPVTRGAYLRTTGQHRIALENEADALWRRALNGCCTPADCDAVLEDADRFGETLSMRIALAAKVMCQAADSTVALSLIDEAQSIVRTAGGSPSWREWTSRLVVGLRHADRPCIEEVRQAWLARAARWSSNEQVLDRLFIFADYPARFPHPPVPGPEDPSLARQRWHTIIATLVQR